MLFIGSRRTSMKENCASDKVSHGKLLTRGPPSASMQRALPGRN
jgi:hypothetical protein